MEQVCRREADTEPPGRARYHPDLLERIFHAALQKGDAKGVEAALILLARRDPERAVRLHDELKTALAIRQALAAKEERP